MRHDALRHLHDAANVLAKSGLRTVKTNDICIAVYKAIDEITRLHGVLANIAHADVPRPAHKLWRADGKASKYDLCTHGVPFYEDCSSCVSDYARAALAEKETK